MKPHPVLKRMPILLFALVLAVLSFIIINHPPRDVGALSAQFSCDQIPALECEALESLFLNTNGNDWFNNNGWLTTSTPCSWFGITCNEGKSNVTQIILSGNNLNGPIPIQLSNLSELIWLDLGANNLTGEIPRDLSNLLNLRTLYLAGNNLTGPIPYQLGRLSNLELLYLNRNKLEGTIPQQIGDLTQLQFLYLDGSQLSGQVPESLCSIDTLVAASLGYNMLSLGNAEGCIPGLDSVSANTQTVPPANLEAVIPVTSAVENYAIQISWNPIEYATDTGFYEILMSSTSGGPYQLQGRTIDKSISQHTVRELEAGTPYYFVVRTITNPNPKNQNQLISATSSEVSGTPNALTLTNFGVTAEKSAVAVIVFGIALIGSLILIWQFRSKNKRGNAL